MTADQLTRITELHVINNKDIDDLVRLAKAVAAVRGHIDTGALFEGYDGREPQRTQACAAIDELEAAARRVDYLLAQLCAKTLPPTVHHL